MDLRSARREDLEAVVTLARTCGLLEPGIAEAIDGFAVAIAGDRLVGACGLEAYGDLGFLRTLAVDPDYRRQGLGRRLVEATLERGRALGLSTTYLLTTTARTLFVGLGFEEVARDDAPEAIQGSWEFRAGCPSSAILMRRKT